MIRGKRWKNGEEGENFHCTYVPGLHDGHEEVYQLVDDLLLLGVLLPQIQYLKYRIRLS